ncbi:MAG: hypothetical protein RR795_01480 [Cetobacterium sp.]|uniref:hypothetical protein n=1 Tax=Cetobacterium sp. TaxID=2071632 RepID=UPI002FC95C98
MTKKYIDVLTCMYDGYQPHFLGYKKLGSSFKEVENLNVECEIDITEEFLNSYKEYCKNIFLDDVEVGSESLEAFYNFENDMLDCWKDKKEIDKQSILGNRNITKITTYEYNGNYDDRFCKVEFEFLKEE